ncbi:resolvase domain-containing protein, partial [mine drainage metagenome]
MTFGAARVDEAVARELIRAVEPMAIEAAVQAESRCMEIQSEQRHMAELDLQQARYEASLAERRYAACDPENRLIAAQLEKSWEATLQRVQACEERLMGLDAANAQIEVPDFGGIAADLGAAWNAPGVTMRARQQLLRALIVDVVATYDRATRDITLTIHWRGGQHSELKVQKPKTGEHSCRTPEEALAVIRTMASRWSDTDIATSLNRMAIPTAHGKTWNAIRVISIRQVHGIRAYRSAEKSGEWLTMSEAAVKLGVTNHQVRRLIKEGVLSAEQVVFDAPYQIRASDLQDERVIAALSR